MVAKTTKHTLKVPYNEDTYARVGYTKTTPTFGSPTYEFTKPTGVSKENLHYAIQEKIGLSADDRHVTIKNSRHAELKLENYGQLRHTSPGKSAVARSTVLNDLERNGAPSEARDAVANHPVTSLPADQFKFAYRSAGIPGPGGADFTEGFTTPGPRGQRQTVMQSGYNTVGAYSHEYGHSAAHENMGNVNPQIDEAITEHFTLRAEGLSHRVGVDGYEIYNFPTQTLRSALQQEIVTEGNLANAYYYGQINEIAPLDQHFHQAQRSLEQQSFAYGARQSLTSGSYAPPPGVMQGRALSTLQPVQGGYSVSSAASSHPVMQNPTYTRTLPPVTQQPYTHKVVKPKGNAPS